MSEVFQRITFEYRVRFVDEMPFSSFSGETREVPVSAGLTVGDVTLSDAAQFQLIKSANPYMLDLADNATHHWLSSDIRVFPMIVGSGDEIAGQSLNNSSKNAAFGFLQNVLNNIGSNEFSNLPADPVESALSLYPMTTEGDTVYNFAIARVRVRADTGLAPNVRVFFRIFESQTTAALTYKIPGGGDPIEGYKKYTNPAPIAAPGTNDTGTEWISFPCFAEERASTPEDQTDGNNVQTIDSGFGSGEVYTYFGCLLDNNLNEPYLPSTPTDSVDQGLSSLLTGSHQCIVAQIEYDPAPLVHRSRPATSDKLSQRNVAISVIANPGTSASRAAFHTFELERTPHWDPEGRLPDELMLECLGPFPKGTEVHIYMPEFSAVEAVQMADTLYARHDLRVLDAQTIACTLGGISYVPLPPKTKRQFGLIKAVFPEGVKRGQRFDLVVRQITNKSRSVPIRQPRVKRVPRQDAAALMRSDTPASAATSLTAENEINLNADNPDLTYFPSLTMLNIDSDEAVFVETPGAAEAYEAATHPWREVVGSFQMAIPVSVKSEMLVDHLRLLSLFYWRLDRMKDTNRWYLVLKRFVEELVEKVRALGGDPLKVPATPDGWWPGLAGDGDGGDKPGDKPDGDSSDDDPGDDGAFPDYGGWLDDGTGKGLSRTGKISGIAKDHFGDFEAFFLEDHKGHHFRYLSRDKAMFDTVWEAWKERYTVTVHALADNPEGVKQIIVRGYL